MKRELLTIAIALTTVLSITAICAHITAMSNLEAKHSREIQIRDTRINALREGSGYLQATLRPKPYANPVEQMWISSATGYRTDPMGGSEYERLHKGVDLAGMVGDPVYAVLSGIVAEHWIPPDGGQWKGHIALGGMITIQHENFFTIYGHLSESYVHEGDWVEQGQLIGRIGNTGISTGAHLHLEVVVDPLQYLKER